MARGHPIDIPGDRFTFLVLQRQQDEGNPGGRAEDIPKRKDLLDIGCVQADPALLLEQGSTGHSDNLRLILEVWAFDVGPVDDGYHGIVEVELDMDSFAGALHKIIAAVGFQVPVINLPHDAWKG